MELNKPYLVKRVASKNGVLHYLPLEAFCDGITIGKPQLAKRVALKDGVLHYLMSDQKLDETTGKLIIGKPYFAKRVKQNEDGTLHYVVSGKQCEEGPGPVEVCTCEISGTLEATVQFPTSLSTLPTPFGSAIDVTLTAGGSFNISNFFDCYEIETPEEHICTKQEISYSGGSGSFVSGAKTYHWTTTVWVSPEQSGGPTGLASGIWADNIIFTGDFKVFFAATQYRIEEEGEPDEYCCAYEWGVLVKYNVTNDISSCSNADAWGFWVRRSHASPTLGCTVRWVYGDCEYPDNDCCPPDYANGTPETSFLEKVCYPSDGFPYVDGGDVLDEGCIFGGSGPMSTYGELWTRLSSNPDTDDYRAKCIRMTIADLS